MTSHAKLLTHATVQLLGALVVLALPWPWQLAIVPALTGASLLIIATCVRVDSTRQVTLLRQGDTLCCFDCGHATDAHRGGCQVVTDDLLCGCGSLTPGLEPYGFDYTRRPIHRRTQCE